MTSPPITREAIKEWREWMQKQPDWPAESRINFYALCDAAIAGLESREREVLMALSMILRTLADLDTSKTRPAELRKQANAMEESLICPQVARPAEEIEGSKGP